MKKRLTLLMLFITFLFFGSWAHGNYDTLLVAINQKIALDSLNAELYMERGGLNREHEKYELSQIDFNKSLSLDSSLSLVYIELAILYIEWQQPEKGLASINIFLDKRPDHVQGIMTRSKLHLALGDYNSGIIDLKNAIEKAANPRPENYLDLAKTILLKDSTNYQDAISIIDMAHNQLGFLVTLENYCIEWELKRKNYKGAIERIDRILEKFTRKETWLTKKAEIWALKGNKKKALSTYDEAQQAIDNLPKRLTFTKMIKALQERINEGREKLK